MEFTMVNAVPRDSAGAFLATSVENRGESATTVSPQKIRKPTSNICESWKKIIGDRGSSFRREKEQ